MQIYAKGVYAFVVMALWVRLMRYYAVSEFLGPKVRTSLQSLLGSHVTH